MQLLAKFKQILYVGFRATLNFRKFKVALNPMYRIALNVSLNLSIYYSFRHVLKPGTPEHPVTPQHRNTQEHRNTGTLWNTPEHRNRKKTRNTYFDGVVLLSYYRPCKK